MRISLPAVRGDQRVDFALHGGEEYELLFAARPDRRIPKQIAGVAITQIGEIVSGKRMMLADSGRKDRRSETGGLGTFQLGAVARPASNCGKYLVTQLSEPITAIVSRAPIPHRCL